MKLKPVVASLVMLGLMAPAFARSSLASQQAVIDQNSVTSPVSSEGWFNRVTVGGVGSVVGIFGNHDPAGYFTNANNSSDLYVNNFNLLVNANLSKWSKATLNLAYLGAPNPWTEAALPTISGTDPIIVSVVTSAVSNRRIMHTVVADEAYVEIGDLAKYPFYIVAGKKYVPFGDYADPYTPYQIMSPAQMLAQTNAVAAIVGVTSNFGFYGSLFAFRGETSPIGSTTGNIRNFGAKIGYYDHLDAFNSPNTHINFALSYINNLWDSQVFGPDVYPQWSWGTGYTNGLGIKNGHPVVGPSKLSSTTLYGYQIDPVGGVSLHADLAYKAFSMSANWVGAIKKMVTADYSPNQSNSSKFWGADVNADYAFKTLERDSHLGAGVQFSGSGSWFSDNTAGLTTNSITTDWAYIVPKWRLVAEYKINLFKNTDLGLTVAHGKSYDFVVNSGSTSTNNSSLNTTVGLARLMVQL